MNRRFDDRAWVYVGEGVLRLVRPGEVAVGTRPRIPQDAEDAMLSLSESGAGAGSAAGVDPPATGADLLRCWFQTTYNTSDEPPHGPATPDAFLEWVRALPRRCIADMEAGGARVCCACMEIEGHLVLLGHDLRLLYPEFVTRARLYGTEMALRDNTAIATVAVRIDPLNFIYVGQRLKSDFAFIEHSCASVTGVDAWRTIDRMLTERPWGGRDGFGVPPALVAQWHRNNPVGWFERARRRAFGAEFTDLAVQKKRLEL